jgi:hypothetical protein
MNDKIRELLLGAGFCFWADEEWGPGVGKVDWNCDYEKEMERFVELLEHDWETKYNQMMEFYVDRIAHLDESLVRSMDMNRELMSKIK